LSCGSRVKRRVGTYAEILGGTLEIDVRVVDERDEPMA
jgi:hypothetical protein